MNNRFLVAGLVVLGVAACGDEVTIQEPTPPPPPPFTASIAPLSATVAIGGNVVFAVNASGGAAGEVASWTCASSDTGVATASNASAGCQATGVAAGGVSITAAVTKGGETFNVGAHLTVTEEEPAFLVLASITDATDDDDTLSGRVSVVINVERGDQTLEGLSVLVDGAVVVHQSFGTVAMTPPEESAAEQAVHSFILSFNSAGYGDDGTPDHMNGEHTISAELQAGGETIASNNIPAEFSNADGVHVTVSGLGGGAMNSETGQMWYGGPSTMVEITAVPVLYSGGSAASVGIGAFCGADADTEDQAPFMFTPECEGTSVGVTPEFTIAGTDVPPVNNIDALYLDYEGPSAPTFFPNPNGREDGWVNMAVDLLGEQSSNEDGWLTYNDDDAGVGGYVTQLRYGADLEEALAAPASTMATLPEESDVNEYCAVASAVDLLGNESDLPDGACVDAATYTLANAGILVGVDVTAPAVQFTAASTEDGATDMRTDWVLYVTDGGSGLATDPVDASIKFRDGAGEEDLDQADFTITPIGSRYTTAVLTPAVGYHTFSATATDKAGNESASDSRVALNDTALPSGIELFIVPGDDDYTREKTLLATDNLSIASYHVNALFTTTSVDLVNPEIVIQSVAVDAYNASDLTDDLLVRALVNLPFLAVQDGMGATPAAIATVNTYVSDQVGVAAGVPGDLDHQVATDDILEVDFRTGGGGFTVAFEDLDGTIEFTATADLAEVDTSIDFPFSRVDFYGEITRDPDGTPGNADDYSELRFIGSADGLSATSSPGAVVGLVWTYAAEFNTDDVSGENLVAFGVSTVNSGSVAVVAVSTGTLP